MKKALTTILGILACASLLSPQSLSELAKQEKERREALKGKRPPVVTNADLAKTRKRAAIETRTDAEAAAPNAETVSPVEPPEEAAVLPAEPAPSPPAQEAAPGSEAETPAPDLKSLTAKHAQAKEYADLLELKMGALWQQFYSLNDTTPREAVQQEIALTFDKLEKAREAERLARKELDDYLERAGRDAAAPLWIR
jgi:hypothetical protein